MELINDPAYQHHVRRAAAQTYARHGWSVIPLTSGKKHPPLVAWKTYATERPTLDRVRRWFQRWPTANIGVVTGAVSGITVLDVDVKPGKRGDHTLAALVEKHGSLPLTAQQQTWSGGTQFLFAHAPGVRNSSGAIGPGLDIRGEGGYIVVAPSIVETEGGAGSYVWKTPWNVPWLPCPRGCCLTSRTSRTRSAHPADRPRADATIPCSGWLAPCAFKHVATPRSSTLRLENRDRCQPPLPIEEVDTIVRKALTLADRPGFGDGSVEPNGESGRGASHPEINTSE